MPSSEVTVLMRVLRSGSDLGREEWWPSCRKVCSYPGRNGGDEAEQDRGRDHKANAEPVRVRRRCEAEAGHRGSEGAATQADSLRAAKRRAKTRQPRSRQHGDHEPDLVQRAVPGDLGCPGRSTRGKAGARIGDEEPGHDQAKPKSADQAWGPGAAPARAKGPTQPDRAGHVKPPVTTKLVIWSQPRSPRLSRLIGWRPRSKPSRVKAKIEGDGEKQWTGEDTACQQPTGLRDWCTELDLF